MNWQKTILFFWVIIAFYFGFAGIYMQSLNSIKTELKLQSTSGNTESGKEYLYDNISFSSPELIDIYKDKKKYNTIFGWYTNSIPESLLLILATMFIASIGVAFRLIYRTIINRPIDEKDYLSHLSFGLLIGFIIWLLVYITPSILYENKVKINFEALFLIAIISGVFYKRFFEKLKLVFEKVFKDVSS